jgi:hypothetical protein
LEKDIIGYIERELHEFRRTEEYLKKNRGKEALLFYEIHGSDGFSLEFRERSIAANRESMRRMEIVVRAIRSVLMESDPIVAEMILAYGNGKVLS